MLTSDLDDSNRSRTLGVIKKIKHFLFPVCCDCCPRRCVQIIDVFTASACSTLDICSKVYQKAKAEQASKTEEKEDAPNRRYHREPTVNPMAPKTQGALILQSLLHLPAPHNQVVLDRYKASYNTTHT